MFRHHVEALRKKLKSREALLRRIAESEWDANAKTLQIAALSLLYYTSEYCAPVLCRSTYTRLICSVFNDVMDIITGCLRLTPTDYICQF